MAQETLTFMVIAHRGASGYEPENTLRSFKRAIELKAPAIELDVYRLPSGELVVIHDDTLDRTTNATGAVCSHSYDELVHIDAGKGERIPQLYEVFDLVDKQAIINIELKGAGTAYPVAQLIYEYVRNKQWSYNNFIISSFDHEMVMEFNRLCPEVPVGFLFFEDSTHISQALAQTSINYIIVSEDMVSQELVQSTHRAHKKLFVYTIDNKKRALELKALGVDGIYSDYPDILSPENDSPTLY